MVINTLKIYNMLIINEFTHINTPVDNFFDK